MVAVTSSNHKLLERQESDDVERELLLSAVERGSTVPAWREKDDRLSRRVRAGNSRARKRER